MEKDPLVTPVVKWAGGKRQLLPKISKLIPTDFSTYYEPFVGGGAVFFALQPKRAVVNDINAELINVYITIRDHVEELIEDLKRHKNEADYFYRIREKDRDKINYGKMSKVKKASRILFLNKTCYNGLFRVNRQGEFNTPFGRYKKPNITNEVTLRAVSSYFNKADISFLCGDFVKALRGVKPGDFVYLDPPYDPVSNSASFTSYSSEGFGRDEQIKLKKICDQLTAQKVKFLLSNSATDFILDLYSDYEIDIVRAKRVINSKGNKRGRVDEVLIKNY